MVGVVLDVWRNELRFAGKLSAYIYIPYYQLLVQSKQINIQPLLAAPVRTSTLCALAAYAGCVYLCVVNYFRFGFHQMPTGNFVYK